MAPSEDLINFDVIEPHKENIQSLPGGRSAKALVSTLAPFSPDPNSTVTPSDTTNINDLARQEYEAELSSIAEADDPLDIYDRYVKWTLSAYPSAQATSQSRLLPLLERATKAFLSSSHYKNDPRYLKLWLHYIRLFSDSPRETFAFLARHHIGDGLALFYEEFATWLETQGRFSQAEEVYRLGIDREARPVERLARKLREFQDRATHRAQNDNGPSSPALPTVRPALAAKVDPFASSSPRRTDPQAAAPAASASTSRRAPAAQKLEVFADGDAPPPASSLVDGAESSQGWENIGSIAQRKKENVIEPRPWVGETLKAGKKTGGAGKMMIFKDENIVSNSNAEVIPRSSAPSSSQVIKRATGKSERVFVDLDMLYPNPKDPTEEMSIEEVRAARRGWLNRCWSEEEMQEEVQPLQSSPAILATTHGDAASERDHQSMQEPELAQPVIRAGSQDPRPSRSRKMGIMEIKGETQTIKTNLDSPTKPKMRRKSLAEPTMTFHTRAATDEIYDIFNQPLHLSGGLTEEATPEGERSDEEEDAYASGGETTTGTGRVSVNSETESREEDEEEEAAEATGSEWSEFTARKHIPDLDLDVVGDGENGLNKNTNNLEIMTQGIENMELRGDTDLITPTSPDEHDQRPTSLTQSTFIPMPPDDYEHVPRTSYREVCQTGQTRLPFMTPIVERTESSLAPSMANYQRDSLPAMTPSRGAEMEADDVLDCDELMSSPFQELIKEAVARHKRVVVAPKQESILVDLEDDVEQQQHHQKDEAFLDFSKIEEQSPEDNDEALLELYSPVEKAPLEVSKSEEHFPEEEDLLELSKFEDDALLDLCIPTSERDYTPEASSHHNNNNIPRNPIIKEKVVIPTDDHIRQTILEHSEISSFPGFFDHRGHTSGTNHINKTGEIRKYIKSLKSSSSSSHSSKQDKPRPSSLARPPTLQFEGSKREYIIKKELGKGAFAPVYLVESNLINTSPSDDEEEDEDDEHSTSTQNEQRQRLEALKMEDPPSTWEFYIMRTAFERLSSPPPSSTSSSAYQQAYPPSVAASIIRAHEFHSFDTECYLFEDFRNQGTLLDLINLAKSSASPTSTSATSTSMTITAPSSGSAGMLNETLIIFFTVELMRIIEALHSRGIIHGDIKADNCLLRLDPPYQPQRRHSDARNQDMEKEEEGCSQIYSPLGSKGWSRKGISLIDFGRGIDMFAFRGDVEFKANWIPTKNNNEDCPQIKESREWTFEIDYFGLAGVVHSLLWGRYIDVVPIPVSSQVPGGAGNGGGGTDGEKREEENLKRRRYKLADKFKRYWQVDLWTEVFELLLNPLSYPSTSPPSSSLGIPRKAGIDGDGRGDLQEDEVEDEEERMRLPRTKAMRRVRRMLERWLIDHGNGGGGGSNGVGLKELLRRVEIHVSGGSGGGSSSSAHYHHGRTGSK
ncbi:MAG: hypothetical protein M1823_001964 [Watsoniomyces obsoletus]|nr:MAG: hypothetical protein M1823_001964 [Watsoniomyces obsoletus]